MRESLGKNNHITIITYNWPPRNAIGTHRAYAWARHWSEAGVAVTVLTAEKHSFDEPLDLNLPAPKGVRVIEIPFGRTAKLAGHVLRFGVLRRVAKAIKKWLNRWSNKNIDPRSGWRSAAISEALDIAEYTDIVVSTYGPAASHLIASDMKQINPSIFWVADYRDLWTECHYQDLSESAVETMRQQERASVGQFADLLTTVSNNLKERLAELTGKPVHCIPNGFDIDEDTVSTRLKSHPGVHGHPFRIVYTGTLHDGIQDPRPLLDALNTIYQKGLIQEGDVIVEFYGSRLEPLDRIIRDPDYRRFVVIKGHTPRQEALDAQCQADLVLLLGSPRPDAAGVLTGKLFEYIASGRPILSIGSRPEYEMGKVISETGTGLTFGPDEYYQLNGILLDTLFGGGVFDAYSPKINEVLKYSRKHIAHQMLSCITE